MTSARTMARMPTIRQIQPRVWISTTSVTASGNSSITSRSRMSPITSKRMPMPIPMGFSLSLRSVE